MRKVKIVKDVKVVEGVKNVEIVEIEKDYLSPASLEPTESQRFLRPEIR